MAEKIHNQKNIELIREKLGDVNELIKPYQLAYVNPIDDCVPLERNAHYMEKQILDRLTANIAEDGFLSQLPFGMKRGDGKFLILSGNHRLKAAIKAKLDYILILYIDEVDKDRQIAYTLSHNALVGKDDIQMLKDIYNEISSIEAREFSGLNGIKFIDVEKLQTASINDGDIELTEMKFLFVESKSNYIGGGTQRVRETGHIKRKCNYCRFFRGFHKGGHGSEEKIQYKKQHGCFFENDRHMQRAYKGTSK